MWDTIGPMQLAFLVARGLRPQHRLLDIGCGSLRGGIHFIAYLDPERYFGIDRDGKLIEAGLKEELPPGVQDAKRPIFAVREDFDISVFGAKFDFAIAQSVFTHLPLNSILRCLVNVARTLTEGGVLYATFFENTLGPMHLDPIEHQPGGIITFPGRDPYHYPFETLAWAAGQAGLTASYIGDWNHPRAQRMATFTH